MSVLKYFNTKVSKEMLPTANLLTLQFNHFCTQINQMPEDGMKPLMWQLLRTKSKELRS